MLLKICRIPSAVISLIHDAINSNLCLLSLIHLTSWSTLLNVLKKSLLVSFLSKALSTSLISALIFISFCLLCVDFALFILVYHFFFLISSWPCPAACRILAPQPGIKGLPPAVEAWSLIHWTPCEAKVAIWLLSLLWCGLWVFCIFPWGLLYQHSVNSDSCF